jgi:hypothetical protein
MHVLVGGAGNDEWPDRALKGVTGGVSRAFQWVSYGLQQSMATLRVVERDRIEWEAIRSVDGFFLEKIVIKRGKDGANEISIQAQNILPE